LDFLPYLEFASDERENGNDSQVKLKTDVVRGEGMKNHETQFSVVFCAQELAKQTTLNMLKQRSLPPKACAQRLR